MSSYSEYLGRYKQKMTTYTDTRPHRSAGHQTEIVKRLAASGNLETAVAKTACVLPLNAPSTRSGANYNHGGGHNVQDMSSFVEYTSGQALAQASMSKNAKPSQITNLCLSTAALPEFNDKLAADAQLSLIQAAKNGFQRGYYGCAFCGSTTKVQFASGCNCRLTTAQAAGFKSVGAPIHTIEPNANVA